MAILIYLGDIIYLNILGQPIVVLNSKEAIADLLDTRGSIYSDRPTLAVVRNWLSLPIIHSASRFSLLFCSNMIRGGMYWALPALPYGEEMHTQRVCIYR